MRPGALRALSSGERDLAVLMFGAGLDTGRVKVLAVPVWRRAFVPHGGLMIWPAAEARLDFADAPIPVQAVFVHELTHVWQGQRGINLLAAKLRAGDSQATYAYDLSDDTVFAALNIEQQAMIVQDGFLALQGHATPYEFPAYSKIFATWLEADLTKPHDV